MSSKLAKLDLTKLRNKLSENRELIATYLGQGCDVDHYSCGVIEEFERNPALYNCSAPSIFEAVRKLALIGLTPGLPSGQEHVYFVPYGRTCNLIVSYRGLIELARRSGFVLRVVARSIHEEGWEWDDGLEPWIRSPQQKNPIRTWETMTHVYAHFLLDGGLKHLEIMTKDEVEQHKQRYVKAVGKDSPWQTDPLAMARKTVIRRAFASGQIPVNAEVRRIVAADEFNEVIDGRVVDSAGPDQPMIDEIEQQGMTEAGVNSNPGELFDGQA